MQEQLKALPISDIYPNPFQPRIEFSDEELAELSQSIAENGLIQPIIVRKSDIIGYELIAGERRLRACKRLGMTEIPAVVKEVTDQESRKQSIIENLLRSNLNPIEEAKAYRSLINELAYSHEELAKAMGKSRPYISNALRLLQLPQEIQTSIENGKLSQGHARALLAVEDTKKQLTIYHQVLTEKWSVRTLEKRLQELPKKQKSKKDIHIKDKEKKLERIRKDYWAAIKICIRNRYEIKEPHIWCDYIKLLKHFKKDIHNAKYVCPANLHAEHDRLVQKRNVELREEQMKKDLQKALTDEKKYKEQKGRFFGLSFSDGTLKVKVLESVTEFFEEGMAMHHCVFSNQYYLKEDSLILSASIEGKRIETIELSLDTMQIVQSRGACNMNTSYHRQIIELVNKNIQLIEQRLTA